MRKQLSADSAAATSYMLAGSIVLVVLTLVIVIKLLLDGLSHKAWPGAMQVLWGLLVVSKTIHRLTFYQITLANNTLLLTRIFSRSVSYPTACFVSITPGAAHGKPLRLSFKEGRSFTFLPKLTSSEWSIYYLKPADFIERWSAILKGRRPSHVLRTCATTA